MPGIEFTLKQMPDGFGFLYGTLIAGGASYRVDVLPPVPFWQGQFKLNNHQPHATDWIIFVDGNELARVSHRDDIAACVQQRLLARKV